MGYSPDLNRALLASNPDLVHTAGLWMYPSLAARNWSRSTARPYVVSPHGMLDAWALGNSAWKKKAAAALFERSHLDRAACLHALCPAEAQSFRDYGLRNPICVIPNGVDLPDESQPKGEPPWQGRWPASSRILLFLGRLHPKKGLLQLLTAWRTIQPGLWRLAIAGWDQGGHQKELETFVHEHGLADTVAFLGPIHGHAKSAAYASAQAFILPSFSEGLPMTILEAWAAGLPVLQTDACNLPEGLAAGASIAITTDPDQMARSLLYLMEMPESERIAMGVRGRQLAHKQFNWTKVAGEMAAVYRWALGAGPQPACVQI